MRLLRVLVLACLLALPMTVPAAAEASEAENAMVLAINQVRADHGLRKLRVAPSLTRSSGHYASWMIRHDWFGHRGASATRRFVITGEIIALHYGTKSRVRRTLRAWLNSGSHRYLILHPSMRYLGAGKARGRFQGRRAVDWVVHFGGRRRK